MMKSTEASENYSSQQTLMGAQSIAQQSEKATWKDYISVVKVGIVTSNLFMVIVGMWLAAGSGTALFNHSLLDILLTLLGASFIIASGTCLNNYYERDIDQKMERTKDRPSAQGRLMPNQILSMGFIYAIVGTTLLLFVNLLTTLIALTGLFAYVVLYTMWTKRVHHINTIVGSVSGAVPPLIGWAAIAGTLDAGAWILFLMMFLWQPPHFLAIAMRRSEDYRAAGIPMLPVVRGFEITKQQIVIYVATLLPVSLYLVLVTNVGMAYIVLALILGVGWLIISLSGFFINKEKDVSWARYNFLYSLVYMTVLFGGVMFLTWT